MAKVIEIATETQLKKLDEDLHRAIQSSHLSYLFGAGASLPAIAAAGAIEAEIEQLIAKSKLQEANKRAVEFLKSFVPPMKAIQRRMLPAPTMRTLNNYRNFVEINDKILAERHSSLLPKQVTVFTTNYDLFIERAASQNPSIILNDGFKRTPSLDKRHILKTETFFDAILHTSNLYDYRTELASINLIKLHGSLSWYRDGDEIIFDIVDFSVLESLNENDPKAVDQFLEALSLVLPTKAKFRTTALDRTYYDLLRLYANFLDRENVVLMSFGFSFSDEHILDITVRSLRNPTLLVLIACFDPDEKKTLERKFEGHHNVWILVPAVKGDLDFMWFNDLLSRVVPTGLANVAS